MVHPFCSQTLNFISTICLNFILVQHDEHTLGVLTQQGFSTIFKSVRIYARSDYTL